MTNPVSLGKPLIALLAAPETSPSVLYGFYDVLLSVGAVYPDMTAGTPGDAMLDVRIVAAGDRPFRCFGNVPVEPHAAIDAIDRADVAIVCDMYTPIDCAPHGRYAPEIAWLQRMHRGGALIASVCSGSLILAEAGLLDGRECTAHWAYRDLFRKHYPQVRLTAGSILNVSCEPEGIITAGGVTSWQDLAIHIIARLCGKQHALRTAKVFLLSGHEDGQLPFASMCRRIQSSDAVIADCQRWIAENYTCQNPVASMTEYSGLAPRTFARRFRAATGYLPIDYIHTLRIEEAKQIIETEEGDMDDAGYRVGYEDPAFFRRLFKRQVGLTPAAYRKKFSGLCMKGVTTPRGSVAPPSAKSPSRSSPCRGCRE
jgi:transcriptional regulator GlxA family with amidase domain